MLGKLIKHEFIAVSRIMIPLHLFLIVVTVIGKATLSFDLIQHLPELVNFLMLLTYIVTLIAIPFATCIYMVIRFYRNMFTDEGYLMWTLPVKPWEHLFSKGLVFSIWSVIDLILVLGSMLILIFSGQILERLSDPAVWSEFNGVLETNLGFDFISFILLILGVCIVSTFSGVYLYYCSICIGQLFSKHRILGALLAYVGLYMILQTITTAIMMAYGFTIFSNQMVDFSSIYVNILISSALISVVCGVICYLVSLYIMKRKINIQ